MIDFNTRIFASKRAYVNELEMGKFVFFSPDNKGLPFVAQQIVKEVYERFQDGSTVLDAVSQEKPEKQGNFIHLTKYLFEKGILRDTPTPDRYEGLCCMNIFYFVFRDFAKHFQQEEIFMKFK